MQAQGLHMEWIISLIPDLQNNDDGPAGNPFSADPKKHHRQKVLGPEAENV